MAKKYPSPLKTEQQYETVNMCIIWFVRSIQYSICSHCECHKENVNVCVIFVECPDGNHAKERTKVIGTHTHTHPSHS